MDKSRIREGVRAISKLYALQTEVYGAYLEIKQDFRKMGIDFNHEQDFRNIATLIGGFLKKSVNYIVHAPEVYRAMERQYSDVLEEILDDLQKQKVNQTGNAELENRVTH
ncbi:hypothetical protein HYW20_02130 [Candidatus Woesearchaeota archaeon]|nr:hypothetical protein [Candidatus Woesearchaeota archaeon]